MPAEATRGSARRAGAMGWRRVRLLGPVLAASGLLLAACSSASSSTTSTGAAVASGSKLQVAVVAPFTGAAAQFGVLLSFPCKAAVSLINKAGGVLGHQLGCLPVNDYGDPADAVPSVQKAFATNSNIVEAEGFESDTAATTIPLAERQHVPFFTAAGLTIYDSQSNPYFWRMAPADDDNGAAYVIAADRLHFQRVAVVYENVAEDTANIGGTDAALKNLHMDTTTNITIPGDQSSYASTVAKVVAGNPQVLIFGADPQTSATFLSNYRQLTGGKLPPMISPEANITPDFLNALKKVVPTSYITNDMYFVGQQLSPSQPAYSDFADSMHAVGAPGGAINGVVSSIYDGINIMSLAILEAHSTVGSVYDKDIMQVVAPHPGAVVVHNFAAGAAALKAGKAIQYVGTNGPITFNAAHNFVGDWGVSHVALSTDAPVELFTVPGTEVLGNA